MNFFIYVMRGFYYMVIFILSNNLLYYINIISDRNGGF